jgi:hypothetical protein
MAAIGADKRPRLRDQAEHVAGTQLASVGERQLACSRRRGDGRFSVQSNCSLRTPLGAEGWKSRRIITASEAAGKVAGLARG